MKNEASPSTKICRCIKAPVRVLIRVWDYYIKGVMSYGGMMNCGTTGTSLSWSFSANPSKASEDMRELIHEASLRKLAEEKVEEDDPPKPMTKSKGVPRKFTVGIEKIEEDKACEFNEDFKVNSDLIYLRSRSYAVTKRRMSVLS